MRQPMRLPASDRDRLTALEQHRDAVGERLKKVETMVGEIHGILVNVRGVKWAFDGFFKYAGYVAVAGGGTIAIWKFFTGH